MHIPEDPQGTAPTLGLGAALELIPVATVLTDRSGFLTTANTAWTLLTGLDRIESMGAGWMRLLYRDGRNRVLSAVRHSASGGATLGLDTELLIGGEPVTARLFFRAGPFRSQPAVAVSVVTDVPEPVSRPSRPAEHELLAEADTVIRELFAVGITLESCAEHVGADVGTRLHDAVNQMDKVINRLRRAALDQVSRSAAAGHDGPDELQTSIERLLFEARRAVARCDAGSASAPNEVEPSAPEGGRTGGAKEMMGRRRQL